MSKGAAAQHTTHERYHRSDYLFQQPDIKVFENGLLENVVLCRVGEARGYGTNLDQSFIESVVQLGSAYSQGLKCRFGHPNMSTNALGTYLGRLKNFRVDGDKAKADLQLDEISKKAPGGNLYDYITEMAVGNQDMFGMSIVFEPGKSYQRDDEGNKIVLNHQYDGDPKKPIYESIEKLFACDCVDDPAATDSFFSTQFNKEAFAVQVTQFLDEHEEVFEFFDANPSSLDTFLKRYKEYSAKKNPSAMAKDKKSGGAKDKGDTTDKGKNDDAKDKGDTKDRNVDEGAHDKGDTKDEDKPEVKLSVKAQAALKRLGKKFDVTATTTTGDTIHIITAGEPSVGDQVNKVSDGGGEAPAPDDTYVINEGPYDGWTCVVANGVITEVTTADTIAPDTTPANTVQNEAATDKLKELEAKIEELNKKLSTSPAADETIIAEEGDAALFESDARTAPWNDEGIKIYNQSKRLKELGAFDKIEAA